MGGGGASRGSLQKVAASPTPTGTKPSQQPPGYYSEAPVQARQPPVHCGWDAPARTAAGGVTLRSVSGRSHGGPGEPPSKVRASRPQIDVSSKTAPLPVFPPQA